MSIEKLAKLLNINLNSIYGDQTQYVSTIEWLLNPISVSQLEGRGNITGRTTLLALGFINAAMENPNVPITIFDHENIPYMQVMMDSYIELFVESMPDNLVDCFSRTPTTITFSPKK